MNSIKNKLTLLTKKKLKKVPLIKSMIVGKKNMAGKNNSGKITVSHKGGGIFNSFCIIIFCAIERVCSSIGRALDF